MMMLTATTTSKVVGENTDSLTFHKDEVEMLATIPPFLKYLEDVQVACFIPFMYWGLPFREDSLKTPNTDIQTYMPDNASNSDSNKQGGWRNNCERDTMQG